MNMIEKILAQHSITKKEVAPGEIVKVKIDTFGTTSIPIKGYEFLKIWNPGRIICSSEHEVPCTSVPCAEKRALLERFVKKWKIKHYYEHGRHGILHQLAAEKGFQIPGGLFLNYDSHTCSGGSLNCLSKGIGMQEAMNVLATGETWFRVGETVKFELVGKMPEVVTARDIVLYIGGKWPPFVNKNIEYMGPIADNMSLAGRRCIATASADIGVEFPIFKADNKTVDYVKSRTPFIESVNPVEPDEDALYAEEYIIDVTDFEPQVACPHSMANVKPVSELEKEEVKINLAFIGACTNGRLEDIKIAAEIVKGCAVHPDVRFIVTPASQEIFSKALHEGYIDILTEANALFTCSKCGPCNGGILAAGEVVVTASPRNFKGRMGHPDSFIYCASPATVAASAIAGYIIDPR